MGFTSIWHWIIVLVVVLVLFGGRGKISSLMGDFGKGLKNFKNLSRWYLDIANRDAVIKGYDLYNNGSVIPKI